MDFSVLRSAVLGALDGLQRASETVVSRVFSSAFFIVTAARETSHALVDVAFSLARSVLWAAEQVTAEALDLAFGIVRAVIIAAIGRPGAIDATAQEEKIAQREQKGS